MLKAKERESTLWMDLKVSGIQDAYVCKSTSVRRFNSSFDPSHVTDPSLSPQGAQLFPYPSRNG